jgi:hypothetical protein
MWIVPLTAGLILGAAQAPGTAGNDPVVVAAPVRSLKELVRMNQYELEALYRAADPGPTPAGATRGRAIFKPGSRLTVTASRVIHVLWQGKVFKDDGMMVNRVFGLRAVHARVYPGVSWLDGRPSTIMDYCGTSKLFPTVRDEVREVAPGLYLGLTYIRRDAGPELAMFFALDARTTRGRR